MGSHHRRSASSRTHFGRDVESNAPTRLAPKHRVRVVTHRSPHPPQIVWLTNDLAYAREITAQLNALAGADLARVECWNDSEIQPRWVRAPQSRPTAG